MPRFISDFYPVFHPVFFYQLFHDIYPRISRNFARCFTCNLLQCSFWGSLRRFLFSESLNQFFEFFSVVYSGFFLKGSRCLLQYHLQDFYHIFSGIFSGKLFEIVAVVRPNISPTFTGFLSEFLLGFFPEIFFRIS